MIPPLYELGVAWMWILVARCGSYVTRGGSLGFVGVRWGFYVVRLLFMVSTPFENSDSQQV